MIKPVLKNISGMLVVFAILSLLWAGPSYAGGPWHKLGRGLANAATGWIELFVTMHDEAREKDYIMGYLYGMPKGAVRALIRTLIGAYEILTFPIPIPEDYEYIVEPEFIKGSPFEKTGSKPDHWLHSKEY